MAHIKFPESASVVPKNNRNDRETHRLHGAVKYLFSCLNKGRRKVNLDLINMNIRISTGYVGICIVPNGGLSQIRNRIAESINDGDYLTS
jgi:hypothetical protein